MATKEEMLRAKTFKDVGDEVGPRVFRTLTDGDTLGQPQSPMNQLRTAKLVALLAQHLADQGNLSVDDLDEMLLHVVS
ncbi:hypothetical protein PPN31119_04544 [Pandoraea pnomenusa]|uniref:Uncharacterized protein n=1 Tax=Pandoraea pnomenusa TaxID=93220 RepID=A0ABY6WQE2_9BURK|nr:hypothetical protein [Pandoraea pnomenusa]VVE73239.1 hypothetical protein PPN31119_04544 [Pandoraea pnomenusa]